MKNTILAAALLMAASAYGQMPLNQAPVGFYNNYSNQYWNTGSSNALWSTILFPAQVFNAGANLLADGIRNVSWALRDGYGYGYGYGRSRYGAVPAWNSGTFYRPQAYRIAPDPQPVYLWPQNTAGQSWQYSQIALFDTRPQPQCGWKQSTSLVTEFYWENGDFKKDSSGNYITRQVPKTSWVWSCQ